ncbi:YhgE/Pip family protein [Alkalihalobacillus sp. TS-13]|uniref:YhgE/Pip domain-containing protein n=1 Tax=Alkalihalobacillus sp. TS-13 TaxID=2842455 RepID=UPI001C86B0AC|nr:YhgE/Pip family protein [Alkalihalobacillus sp. TS-13]
MVKKLFQQKFFWGGFVGILVVVFIFTFAFMGSSVNPTVKEMPFAVVIQDEGVSLPNGQQLNIGKILEEQIKKNQTDSIKWTFLNSREKAEEGMSQKEYYAAVVIPSDLSQNIFSLVSPKPGKAEIQVLINEGMNATGAKIAGQMTTGILSKLNQQVQQTLYDQVAGQQKTLTVEQSKALVQPIQVKTEKLNPVPSHTANGNAPALFTQILWLTTFISSMIIYTAFNKTGIKKWTFLAIVSQILAGLLFVTTISGLMFWLTKDVLDVAIPNSGEMFMLMLFIGLMFYFIQGAFLNWIGYVAAPLFVLLFFFSMPVLTMPPEMLPDVTKDWLYSWVPFRYSVESFQDAFFFGRNPLADGTGVLGYFGLAGLVIMLMAVIKPKPVKKTEKSVTVE